MVKGTRRLRVVAPERTGTSGKFRVMDIEATVANGDGVKQNRPPTISRVLGTLRGDHWAAKFKRLTNFGLGDTVRY
jgi:hypothetical protein